MINTKAIRKIGQEAINFTLALALGLGFPLSLWAEGLQENPLVPGQQGEPHPASMAPAQLKQFALRPEANVAALNTAFNASSTMAGQFISATTASPNPQETKLEITPASHFTTQLMGGETSSTVPPTSEPQFTLATIPVNAEDPLILMNKSQPGSSSTKPPEGSSVRFIPPQDIPVPSRPVFSGGIPGIEKRWNPPTDDRPVSTIPVNPSRPNRADEKNRAISISRVANLPTTQGITPLAKPPPAKEPILAVPNRRLIKPRYQPTGGETGKTEPGLPNPGAFTPVGLRFNAKQPDGVAPAPGQQDKTQEGRQPPQAKPPAQHNDQRNAKDQIPVFQEARGQEANQPPKQGNPIADNRVAAGIEKVNNRRAVEAEQPDANPPVFARQGANGTNGVGQNAGQAQPQYKVIVGDQPYTLTEDQYKQLMSLGLPSGAGRTVTNGGKTIALFGPEDWIEWITDHIINIKNPPHQDIRPPDGFVTIVVDPNDPSKNITVRNDRREILQTLSQLGLLDPNKDLPRIIGSDGKPVHIQFGIDPDQITLGPIPDDRIRWPTPQEIAEAQQRMQRMRREFYEELNRAVQQALASLQLGPLPSVTPNQSGNGNGNGTNNSGTGSGGLPTTLPSSPPWWVPGAVMIPVTIIGGMAIAPVWVVGALVTGGLFVLGWIFGN